MGQSSYSSLTPPPPADLENVARSYSATVEEGAGHGQPQAVKRALARISHIFHTVNFYTYQNLYGPNHLK